MAIIVNCNPSLGKLGHSALSTEAVGMLTVSLGTLRWSNYGRTSTNILLISLFAV